MYLGMIIYTFNMSRSLKELVDFDEVVQLNLYYIMVQTYIKTFGATNPKFYAGRSQFLIIRDIKEQPIILLTICITLADHVGTNLLCRHSENHDFKLLQSVCQRAGPKGQTKLMVISTHQVQNLRHSNTGKWQSIPQNYK